MVRHFRVYVARAVHIRQCLPQYLVRSWACEFRLFLVQGVSRQSGHAAAIPDGDLQSLQYSAIRLAERGHRRRQRGNDYADRRHAAADSVRVEGGVLVHGIFGSSWFRRFQFLWFWFLRFGFRTFWFPGSTFALLRASRSKLRRRRLRTLELDSGTWNQ